MNKMKPSALIRVGMASMLTLGFASSLFYYNEINKKNEIVMTEELYNPSVYKEEVVELNETLRGDGGFGSTGTK